MPTLFQAMVFALLLPAMAAGRTVADQPLLLDVFVNGENIGKIGEFVLRGDDLLATKNELRALGFRVPADLTDRATGKVIGTPSLISLGALSGVSWHIDTETQSIQLTVPLVRLLNTVMGDDTPAKLARREQPESSLGVTMNYDTAASLSQGVGSASGLFDLRQYSRLGAFSSSFLTYYGGNRPGEHVVRLDTTFTRADAARMRRLNLGDFVSGSLAWSRPVRLEGAQVRSDFSTRPDLITFPLPTLQGSVSVPSSIQVFNDAGQSLSSQVSTGAFQIPQVPMVTGAGTLILSVTDATGRQVTTQQSFYASASLLRPGLQSYSIEAGRTRLNWGLRSEDFGGVAGVGTYRRGITPSFTAEGTAQFAMQGGMAGAGAVVKVGNFGTMNGAVAASSGPKGPGGQISLDVERRGRYTSLTASYLSATSHFSDIASLNGDRILRSQLTVSGSLSSRRGASIGMLYAAVHRDLTTMTTTMIAKAEWPRTETAALTYTQQMRGMSAYVNTYEDLTNHSLGLLAGFVIPLGRRTSVNVSAGYSGTPTQVQVSKPAAEIGEWGFQAFADASRVHHVFGDVERRTEHGFVTAGLDSADGVTTLRTTSSGSISLVDRGVFLANHIQDSFAVVDLSGLAGVRVLDEQRVVGRSDRRGRLLVPDLWAYQANHLAIDTSDVPLDITLTDTSRTVRPRDRSGVIVRFNTADSHSALVTFVDGEGAQVPVGTIARTIPGGEPSPVGYDGSAYLVDLSGINRVKLDLPDGSSCYSEFKYVHLPGTIAAIGPLPCK